MTKSTTGLRLKEKTKKRLETLGEVRDRSTSYLMNAAIEQYLDREEALENERELIRSRWEKFELTGEIVSHSDVKDWVKNLKTKTT